jgi:diguanylate cyclase (GGDEF)-like protein
MPEPAHSESILSRVSEQLAALEKRDWLLWLIVAGTGVLASSALLALIFPSAILKQGDIRIALSIPRDVFVAAAGFLVIFNTYMISKRLELRRLRERVISTSIQNELTRLQSFTDPLTEVYNRRALDDMARRYMARAQRLGKALTFMVIDTDRFKEINTRFGHLTGDFVIAEIAAILRGAVRGSDSVVRYGGDEFLVILADAPLEGAKIAVARIEKSVDDWNKSGQLQDFDLSLSIGLAEWKPGQNLDQILTEADKNMYAIKDARKSSAK